MFVQDSNRCSDQKVMLSPLIDAQNQGFVPLAALKQAAESISVPTSQGGGGGAIAGSAPHFEAPLRKNR